MSGLLVTLLILAVTAACSRQPQAAPSGPEPPARKATAPAEGAAPTGPNAAAAPAPALELPGLLAELRDGYSATEVATTLESLPVLLPYFESEEVTSGELAAAAHWDGLTAEGRARFATHLRRVFDLCRRMQRLTADLPNGYHDVAWELPESRAVYLPVLEQYGLDPETATSYDIASSVSTYHESAIQVGIAAMLAGMAEAERTEYLERFREGTEREEAGLVGNEPESAATVVLRAGS